MNALRFDWGAPPAQSTTQSLFLFDPDEIVSSWVIQFNYHDIWDQHQLHYDNRLLCLAWTSGN